MGKFNIMEELKKEPPPIYMAHFLMQLLKIVQPIADAAYTAGYRDGLGTNVREEKDVGRPLGSGGNEIKG